MSVQSNHTAHTSVAIAWPAWVVSIMSDTLPAVQWISAFLAGVASVIAIALYIREWRKKP